MSVNIDKWIHENIIGECWHEFKYWMPEDERCCSYDSNCKRRKLKILAKENKKANRWVPNKCGDPHTELRCTKCHSTTFNPSYTKNSNDFWVLLRKLSRREGSFFSSFIVDEVINKCNNNYLTFIYELFLNQEEFCKELYIYISKRPPLLERLKKSSKNKKENLYLYGES